MRPNLVLVPPYTAKEVLAAMAEGSAGYWDPCSDKTHQDALSALIGVWAAQGTTLGDLRVLAQYNAYSQRRWNARLLVGCDIRAEVEVARKSIEWRDVQIAALRERVP